MYNIYISIYIVEMNSPKVSGLHLCSSSKPMVGCQNLPPLNAQFANPRKAVQDSEGQPSMVPYHVRAWYFPPSQPRPRHLRVQTIYTIYGCEDHQETDRARARRRWHSFARPGLVGLAEQPTVDQMPRFFVTRTTRHLGYPTGIVMDSLFWGSSTSVGV